MKNLILATDSYKFSHFNQFQQGQTYSSYYVAPRAEDKNVMFFGAQAMIKEYLIGHAFDEADVMEAAYICKEHGVPFNKEGWLNLLYDYKGKLPIEINAVPEGTIMKGGIAQLEIHATDEKYQWLIGPLETLILRGIWYPSTIATHSYNMVESIRKALEVSSDDPEGELPFKLHDFGARGNSSGESAGLAGMAHLLNSWGTDTIEGVMAAKRFYNAPVSGFSIPAAEHSTVTSWGREGEEQMLRNMLKQYPTGIIAWVADSYNIWNAVDNIIGTNLKQEILNREGVFVVRPDSGDPILTPIEVIHRLMSKFGYAYNSKGFKVLPDQVRVIQGDGLNADTLNQLLFKMMREGLSVSNIAFGMGGGLHQNVNRDTFKYAMKCSEVIVNGKPQDVFKDPIAGGKTSLKGTQINDNMRTIFCNGKLLIQEDFETIRQRVKEQKND